MFLLQNKASTAPEAETLPEVKLSANQAGHQSKVNQHLPAGAKHPSPRTVSLLTKHPCGHTTHPVPHQCVLSFPTASPAAKIHQELLSVRRCIATQFAPTVFPKPRL